jgi:hypothetical protein
MRKSLTRNAVCVRFRREVGAGFERTESRRESNLATSGGRARRRGTGRSALNPAWRRESRKRKRPTGEGWAWRSGGQGQNRTADTRIFSPLLYQLSYLATSSLSTVGTRILTPAARLAPRFTSPARCEPSLRLARAAGKPSIRCSTNRAGRPRERVKLYWESLWRVNPNISRGTRGNGAGPGERGFAQPTKPVVEPTGEECKRNMAAPPPPRPE